jgi:hypothetical protein
MMEFIAPIIASTAADIAPIDVSELGAYYGIGLISL